MGIDDTNPDGGAEQDKAPEVDPPKAPEGNEQVSNLNEALRQSREKAAKLQATLDAQAEAQAEAERKAAEAKGQYKGLYETEKERADRLEAENTTYKSAQADREAKAIEDADAILSSWPAEDKALIPDGLAPEARLQTVRALDARLKADSKRPAGTRARGGSAGDEFIPPECEEQAKRLGVDPKAHLAIWKSTTAGRAWAAKQGATD